MQIRLNIQMIAFENFYENRPVFGSCEKIYIADIGETEAKIDSGNEAYNVLHGVNLDASRRWIKFTTINQVIIHRPIIDIINIVAGGDTQSRPVIALDIELAGKQYKRVPFSIADRSKNDEPVLIGSPFIERLNAIIDIKKDSTEPIAF